MAVIERSKLSIRRLRKKLLEATFSSCLYKYTLRGRIPKSLRFTPAPNWAGDEHLGQGILVGQFNLGKDRQIVSADLWSTETSNDHELATLHSFSWLRELSAAVDQDAAQSRLNILVSDWIFQNQQWSPIVWRADVLGERISIWLEHYEQFFAKGSKSFRSLIMRHLSQQLTHLARILEAEPAGAAKLYALKGLIYGAICLPGGDKRLGVLLKKLEREIDFQILEDGGHIGRSPATHQSALRILIEIRNILVKSQNSVPEALRNAIDKMAPALRFYRHQDGRLSQFNGSQESSAEQLNLILIMADARGQPPRRLPYTGYERLLSGRILLLADTGSPPSFGYDQFAHAGALSFEVSIGRERLITNCGSIYPEDSSWRTAQRTTAAHSTLSINDRNSSELIDAGGIGRRRAKVSCDRLDDDQSLAFTASHNGYQSIFGVIHRREIRVSKEAEIIEGIDYIEGNEAHTFTIRFHLHPDVSVSVAQGGQSALMRLAKGGGWKFIAAAGTLRIDESIYLGESKPRRSRQIIVEGETSPGSTEVTWSITAAH
jgi:uncharacterized heparinase superfamily protein